MTMPIEQIIDELETVKAYLKERCGGWPICIDEAIRVLKEKKYMETVNPAIAKMEKTLAEYIEKAKRGEE